MSEKVPEEVLAAVKPGQVVRVYSGKPGCGCGCRGAYSTAPGMVTRTLRAMRARASEVVLNIYPKNYADSEGIVGVIALEDDNRYRWAYLREIPALTPKGGATTV